MRDLWTDDRSCLRSERAQHSIGGGWNNTVHSQGTQMVQGWGRDVIRSDNGGGDR